MASCIRCEKESKLISKALGVCLDCTRRDFNQVLSHIQRAHAKSCIKFDLPTKPPKDPEGVQCNLCVNKCKIPEGERGFCGLRRNLDGKLQGGGKDKGNLAGIMILSPPISHDASGIGIPEA